MRRLALIGWIVAVTSLPGLLAQSIVFVSPSTKGLLDMTCAGGALHSFEQLHYMAVAQYLAAALCRQPRIDSIVGVWHGRAENSGMIDDCPNDRARQLGALLARYYHQEAALVFDRSPEGKTSLVSFRTTQPLSVIATKMAQAKVSGASVLPSVHDNLVLIVAGDAVVRAKAITLSSLLQGRDLREEPGNTELIGDEDRAKAREIFTGILAQAPTDVRQLNHDMYSERFEDLGLQAAH